MNKQKLLHTHLIHGFQQFKVAVDDDCNWNNEAEECVENEIAVVAPWSLFPGQWAGCLDPLRSVGAPAK